MPGVIQTEFISANGLTFETLTCGDAWSETLALCLHGFPNPAQCWLEQMPVLASLGYRVWAPNQRGYGRSSRPPHLQDYAIENLMADVAGLIDASGAKHTVLIGHDWGGIVAWTFAARQIRPLRKLAILNVPHPARFAKALRRPGQMLRSWYAGMFQIPRLPEWLLSREGARPISEMMLRTSTAPDRFPRSLLEVARSNAAQPGALKAMIDWYRALIRGGGLRRQLKQGFPPIQIPALLLWGERDIALAKYTTYNTQQYAPNLEVHYLPGVSHWVQQDATQACNEALAAFLGSAKPQESSN